MQYVCVFISNIISNIGYNILFNLVFFCFFFFFLPLSDLREELQLEEDAAYQRESESRSDSPASVVVIDPSTNNDEVTSTSFSSSTESSIPQIAAHLTHYKEMNPSLPLSALTRSVNLFNSGFHSVDQEILKKYFTSSKRSSGALFSVFNRDPTLRSFLYVPLLTESEVDR
jgi:hypothetical protein